MLAQQQKQDWQAAHLQEDGGVLQNGAAFDESLARVSGSYILFCPCRAQQNDRLSFLCLPMLHIMTVSIGGMLVLLSGLNCHNLLASLQVAS